MIDKKWEKLETLKRHKALTSKVKRKLQKEKELFEKKVKIINKLLEKPTKRTAINV